MFLWVKMPRTMPTPIEERIRTAISVRTWELVDCTSSSRRFDLDLGHGAELGAQGRHQLGPGQVERRVAK